MNRLIAVSIACAVTTAFFLTLTFFVYRSVFVYLTLPAAAVVGLAFATKKRRATTICAVMAITATITAARVDVVIDRVEKPNGVFWKRAVWGRTKSISTDDYLCGCEAPLLEPSHFLVVRL